MCIALSDAARDEMKPRRLIAALIAVCLALSATPPSVLAVSSHLVGIADGGVVAVHDPYGARTGFAFGSTDLVIAGTSVNAGIQLITAHGLSAVGGYVARNDELAIVRAQELHLLALRKSTVSAISSGTRAYILGAPLGYESERIRTVGLPAIELHSTRMVLVAGRLPKSFQGAPVVTRGGRVIGAVAAVGATGWTLAPQSRLSMLVATATNKAGGGEGLPVIAILVGVLVVIAGLGGLVTLRARRRHTGAERAPVVVHQRPLRRPTHRPIEDPTHRPIEDPTHRPIEDPTHRPIEDPTHHATQPLVRRRGPDIDHDDDEDFDVVLKSQEDK
jgi:hypothetical protein